MLVDEVRLSRIDHTPRPESADQTPEYPPPQPISTELHKLTQPKGVLKAGELKFPYLRQKL